MRGLAILLVMGMAGVAHAGVHTGRTATGSGDVPKADRLYGEGLQLRAQHHEDQACAKFFESLRYNDSAVGTILNVARCHEEAGKFASAVKMFSEARDLAREHGLVDYIKVAEQHLAQDEAQVPHVALAFAEAPDLSTTVMIDGQPVPISSVSDLPIDPGVHRLTVAAPGRVPYEHRFTATPQQHVALSIPALAYPVTVKSTRRTIGKILVASGGAAAVAGVVLGVIARGHYQAPFDTMPDDTVVGHCEKASGVVRCNDPGLTHINNARTLGWVGTGVGIAGVVAAGAGAALWLLGSHDVDRPAGRGVAVAPVLAPDQTGIAVFGRF